MRSRDITRAWYLPYRFPFLRSDLQSRPGMNPQGSASDARKASFGGVSDTAMGGNMSANADPWVYTQVPAHVTEAWLALGGCRLSNHARGMTFSA